jgi:hypothetical protein
MNWQKKAVPVVIVVTKIQAQYATTNKELNKKASDKL